MSLIRLEKSKGKLSKQSKPKTKNTIQSENQIQKQAIIPAQMQSYQMQTLQQLQNKLQSVAVKDLQNQYWMYILSKVLADFCNRPRESLEILLKVYNLNRRVYFSKKIENKTQGCNQIRLIYLLIKNLVKFHQQLTFLQKQKVQQIYQQLENWLINRDSPIQQKQMQILLQISQNIWLVSSKGQSRNIIRFALFFLLKLPKTIAKKYVTKEQRLFNQTYIGITLRQMIKFMKKIQLIEVEIQNSFLQFYYSCFQLLVQSVQKPCEVIPVFDLAALTFCSGHSQLFMKMMNFALSFFMNSLQQKRSQLFELNNEYRSYEQNESKIKATLISSSILIFQSSFEDQHTHKKCIYQKEVLFLVILTFKQHLVKLIDQLEKIDKLLIHPNIIKGMFDIATFGSNIYDRKILSKIITKIRQTNQTASFLSAFQPKTATSADNNVSEPLDKQLHESMMKTIETNLFDLLYRIQKSLATYNLQIFMDQYIEHPLTFKRDNFIQNIFKNQHEQIILKFMIKFTSRWLVDQKKINYPLDYQFYLINFLNKCVKQDKIDVIGRFINQISVDELLKINLILYKLTFEDQKKKYTLPESQKAQIQLAHITSVGLADKFMLIDRIMPHFPEQLMWRQFVHHICPSPYHILIKAFYHVANYQFCESKHQPDKIGMILARFQTAVQQKSLQEVFSIFQIIFCVLINKNPTQVDRQLSKRVVRVVVQNHLLFMNLFNQVSESRRTAMNHMQLTQQMVTQNLKCLQKAKRMSSYFLRSILKFLQKIQNIHELTDVAYEKMIQIVLLLSKDSEYTQYHSIRQLSDYSGQKYFSNLLSTKNYDKLTKQRITVNNILMLREVMNVRIIKYPEQSQQNYTLYLKQAEILHYFEFALQAKIEVMNERELLKSKLIVLESIFQIKQFVLEQAGNQQYKSFIDDFKYSFSKSFKQMIVKIAQQNPEYVSKYQRELILHLRVLTITQILKSFGSDYQIMGYNELYNFVFELCFDKHVQIRFFLLNIMVSRFKYRDFKVFLSEKFNLMAFGTIIAIFDNHPAIKQVATKAVESYRKAGDNQACLGLTIMLICLKHILTSLKNSMTQDKCNINVDFFLKCFDRIWLAKKEWQFFAYAFACRFIEEKKISFLISDLNNQGHIQSYICAKEKSDFILQTQIKQYLKKQWQFSFQFPPDQTEPNSKQSLINKIIISLPYRIFAKLKLIIAQKARGTRLIRNKKDVLINWNWLKSRRILEVNEQSLQITDIICFSL